MKGFIEVTETTVHYQDVLGKYIYEEAKHPSLINTRDIKVVRVDRDEHTILYGNEDCDWENLYVKESYEEIKRLIEEAQ